MTMRSLLRIIPMFNGILKSWAVLLNICHCDKSLLPECNPIIRRKVGEKL